MKVSKGHEPYIILTLGVGLLLGALTTLSATEASAETRPTPLKTSPLSAGPLTLDASLFQDSGAIAQAKYGRRYYKRKTYYTSTVEPRTQQTVVVIEDPAPSPPPKVIVHRPNYPRRSYFKDMSLGVRTVGITYGSTELANGKLDGGSLAGVGVGLRIGLDQYWMLEFATDYASGSSKEANVDTMPITASLMARLFPDSMLDIYGIAGGGIHYTRIDYHLPGDITYMRWGGHVGVGSELRLVDGKLAVTGDVRYLALQAPPDGVPKLQDVGQGLDCQGPQCGSDADKPRVVKEDVEDSVTNGVQFMIGIGYRW